MGKRVYTSEMKQFILENNNGRTAKELAALLNEKFGTSITNVQIRSFRQNNNLVSGLTGRFEKGQVPHNKGKKYPNMPPNSGQFQKGNRPHGYQPLGTISYTTDGYPKRKIAEPDRWEYCHRAEWERHNGPIPKGHSVVFLDGDKTNWNISNLACVTRADLAQMNKNRYFDNDADTTKAAIGMVKLQRKVKEITNGNTI
ncbi:TPA: HNH endonuclease signature motif containing protein [Streptococcus suis]